MGIGSVVFGVLSLVVLVVGNWWVKVIVSLFLIYLVSVWQRRVIPIPQPPLQKNERYEEFFWKNSKSHQLFGRIHLPKNPRGVVFFFHGLNNWIDRGVHWKAAQTAAENGYCFALFDQQGFGRSAPGTTQILGYVKDSEDLIDDAEEFVEYIFNAYPQYKNLPFFTMGISMGGAVAMLLSQRQQNTGLWSNFKGMVLLAPAILQTLSTPPRLALQLMHLIMWFGGDWLRWGPKANKLGWCEMIPGLPANQWPLRCPHVHNEAMNSPYAVYPRRMILRTGTQMLRLVAKMERAIEKVTAPFFVVHGEGDGVIPVRSSRLLIERAASTEKSIKLYPKLVHSIFDDPLWEEEVEKDVWNWIIIRTE